MASNIFGPGADKTRILARPAAYCLQSGHRQLDASVGECNQRTVRQIVVLVDLRVRAGAGVRVREA